MKDFLNNWMLVVGLCLTLGMAPYLPEPHIWGKLRWVAGGARGMGSMDWFDLVFHGLPWLLLMRLLIVKGVGLLRKR